MKPLRIEIITYAPTAFFHCQHCELAFDQVGLGERIHREEAREALPDDLRREFQELSDWVHGVLDRYGDRVRVSVTDAASIEGLWKSVRHLVRRYPAVVIGGKEKRIGTDFEALEPVIERYMSLPREQAT